jgi:Lon protease-like protein
MSRSPFDPRYETLPAVLPMSTAAQCFRAALPQHGARRHRRRASHRHDPAERGERGSRQLAFSETEDGRYLITLAGLIRFDVAEELPLEQGYRRAVPNFERFRDDLSEDTDDIDRDSLLEALRAYFEVSGLDSDWSAVEKAPDESLVTSLAMACPFDPPEKQALLEAMTLFERAETLITILRMSVLESDQNMPRH